MPEQPPTEGTTEGTPAETLAENPEADAARAALARARATARAKGLRPGSPAKRRRRDLPEGTRAGQQPGRDPQLIGDELSAFLDERGWGAEVAVGSVVARWAQIVGPDIGAHAEPLSFREGVLTVRGESTAWATQLRLLESSLLARLAEEVGEGTVRELRIVGPTAPSWRKGPLRAAGGRGPRDTYN